MRVTIPVEHGNRAITDGSLNTTIQEILRELKPEAAYFTAQDGQRGGFIVIDLKDPSQIPALAEPWFLAFNARVEFQPVMNADDLKKAEGGIKNAVQKYSRASAGRAA
jgi:hypothetical protein